MQPETIVIGAGLTGITTAYYLARNGHRVTVVEQNPAPAHFSHNASYANGGQISVSHAEPWANPSVLPKMFKWLGKDDAPLLWRFNTDLDQWLWGSRFLFECTPFRWRKNIQNIVNLSKYSRDLLGKLRTDEGIEYEHLEKGIIHFYDNKKEWEAAQRASDVLSKFGCVREPKTVDELCKIEPALAWQKADIVGGTYTPDDESGNAELFTKQLAQICKKKYKVKFEYNTTVNKIDVTPGGSIYLNVKEKKRDTSSYLVSEHIRSRILFTENLVICGGAWSPALSKHFGERLSILPAKGYSMTVDIKPEFEADAPNVSLTDDGHKLVFTRLGNKLRVAGTAEFGVDNDNISPHDLEKRCYPLRCRAAQLFGQQTFDWVSTRYWAGLRPATPSNVPYIGESKKIDNIFFNTGHGTLGWTMACGSGQMIADIIDGTGPEIKFSIYE